MLYYRNKDTETNRGNYLLIKLLQNRYSFASYTDIGSIKSTCVSFLMLLYYWPNYWLYIGIPT